MPAAATRGRTLVINAMGICVIALVAAAWALLGGTFASPQDLTIVIPPGTAERIEAGEGESPIPQEIVLTAGDRLVLVNQDLEAHRIGGLLVAAGATVSARFNEPGTFDYICSVHPSGHTVFQVGAVQGPGRLLWAVLAMAGLLAQVNGLVLGGWSTRRGAGLLGGGAAAMLVGALMVLGPFGALEGAGVPQSNPIAPSAASVSAGERSFARFCVTCHGVGGQGDGPLAVGLEPPPADLALHVPQHPDNVLYRFIQNGIPGTGMPALGGALSPEETWDLVNYLRALAP
jgi:mono/diheme cytochrome c family protein